MDTTTELGHEYFPRVLDRPLQDALSASGAVVIEGARACGKTMTAMHAAASYAFVDDPASRQLINISPRVLLEGARPRLLDEWQTAPELWNLVRRAVDVAAEPGQFLLTGSAVPADDITRHTGAGRFLRLRERTMSWYEKAGTTIGRAEGWEGRAAPSPPTVNISALFSGSRPATDTSSVLSLDGVLDRLLRPGFPAMTALPLTQSAERLRGYIDDIARADIRRLAGIRHEPEVITHLIRALARSTASDVTFATLASDVRPVAPTIKAETVASYVELLQRLFVVEDQLPWTPKLRSRARFRTASKLHLADPALAAAALGAGPQQLRTDFSLLGSLFESAVVHDLAVLTSAMNAQIRHYRDSNGHEVDAVILLPDGRWAAAEVKLGGGQVTAGSRSLSSAIDQIDRHSSGEPAFRLVVTGTGPTLVTDDGTITAPLHVLAP